MAVLWFCLLNQVRIFKNKSLTSELCFVPLILKALPLAHPSPLTCQTALWWRFDNKLSDVRIMFTFKQHVSLLLCCLCWFWSIANLFIFCKFCYDPPLPLIFFHCDTKISFFSIQNQSVSAAPINLTRTLSCGLQPPQSLLIIHTAIKFKWDFLNTHQ